MLAPKNGWLVLSEKFSENSIKTDDSWGCPYDFGHLHLYNVGRPGEKLIYKPH